jgi:hypothetical protein
VARGSAGIALAVLAVAAGMGWLYLLRELGALPVGSHLGQALPLQQLDRTDDQPLVRVIVAWLPAGLAGGLALAWGLQRSSRWSRTVVLFVIASVVLFSTAALSDAIAVSGDVVSRLPDQFSREGIWVEVACFVIGSLPVGRWSRAGSRAAAAAPIRR